MPMRSRQPPLEPKPGLTPKCACVAFTEGGAVPPRVRRAPAGAHGGRGGADAPHRRGLLGHAPARAPRAHAPPGGQRQLQDRGARRDVCVCVCVCVYHGARLPASVPRICLLASPPWCLRGLSVCRLVRRTHTQVVSALMKAGAPTSDVDRSNANGLHLAVRGNREVCVCGWVGGRGRACVCVCLWACWMPKRS
jgi:hypothetical protein